MAWCVGSIFPNPDLLTGKAFGSRLLNGLDPPQRLIDTGCTFQYHSVPEADPHQQVLGFLESQRDVFFPQDLLHEHVEEDASFYSEKSRSLFNVGNRLEGIEAGDGTMQLIFPMGPNIDRIGSCVLSFDSQSSRKICSKDTGDKLYSSSQSIGKPILQVVANRADILSRHNVDCIPLALRTPYQVYFSTIQLQNEDISLGLKRIENFECSTSHVVWNPYFVEEAAVILGNGDLSIFDITSSESNGASFKLKMPECSDWQNCSRPHESICLKKRRRSFTVPQVKTSTKNLWFCDYSWHPRTLLVGGGMHIYLMDSRQRNGDKQLQCNFRNAPSSPGLFSTCKGAHQTDHFTVLCRGTHADMFYFAAASTNHVILYDIRQPRSPVLQWEHRMQVEPPRFLEMVDFSDTCSKSWGSLQRPLAVGRVILACAFRSGEIQAFPYGPLPRSYTHNTEVYMDGLGVPEKFFSWGFPIKLSMPKLYIEQNLEQMFDVHWNNVQSLIPADCDVDQLAGIINYSSHSNPSTVTMVELTGLGSILSQRLHLTEEQGPTIFEHSMLSSSLEPFIATKSGQKTGNNGPKHYFLKHVPNFLSFMLKESVSPEMNAKNCPIATFPHVESVTLKSAEKEMHRPFKNEPAEILPDAEKAQPQNDKMNLQGHLSTGQVLKEISGQLSSVELSFTGTGVTLQPEEITLLKGLSEQIQAWQLSFQPYITHMNSRMEESPMGL